MGVSILQLPTFTSNPLFTTSFGILVRCPAFSDHIDHVNIQPLLAVISNHHYMPPHLMFLNKSPPPRLPSSSSAIFAFNWFNSGNFGGGGPLGAAFCAGGPFSYTTLVLLFPVPLPSLLNQLLLLLACDKELVGLSIPDVPRSSCDLFVFVPFV